MNITIEQLRAADKAPVIIESEGKEYVVLAREIYDRVRGPAYTDSPLTPEEEEAAFLHAGELAGWEDPELDEYNKLAPRKL